MVIIDDKGRIFGIINILDLAILSFVFILVASLFLYSKFPPQLKEHRDVVFQMYFKGAPLTAVNEIFALGHVQYAIGKQVFVPGTKLIATYAKQDKAVITAVKEITDEFGDVNFLITINASLEVDVDGDLLFNGNAVAPGNLHNVQIGSSYFTGRIWRVDYDHYIKIIEVILSTDNEYYNQYSEGDTMYDLSGNVIGNVTEKQEGYMSDYMGVLLQADVYNGAYFVHESPIVPSVPFYFIIDNALYKGKIVGISP